jgi:hypothetical protein
VKQGSGACYFRTMFFVDKNGDIVSEKQFIHPTGEN